ncbi:C-type lectin 37Db-like [Watersipora subatra]|uniref:C-type lectin 37Db-like n=1 Tax=Watersipora subatra TaxID=2589382 RepID=UPI00355C59E8
MWLAQIPTTINSACKNKGGYLATLETEEEVIWMHGFRSFHERLRVNSWIGGQKKGDVWSWKGLEQDFPIQFFDWAETEPDNYEGLQNCLALFGEYTIEGVPVAKTWFRFDDDACSTQNAFICEK